MIVGRGKQAAIWLAGVVHEFGWPPTFLTVADVGGFVVGTQIFHFPIPALLRLVVVALRPQQDVLELIRRNQFFEFIFGDELLPGELVQVHQVIVLVIIALLAAQIGFIVGDYLTTISVDELPLS